MPSCVCERETNARDQCTWHSKGGSGSSKGGSGSKRENKRMSMRIDLEVLSSFDFIITSTSDSECM